MWAPYLTSTILYIKSLCHKYCDFPWIYGILKVSAPVAVKAEDFIIYSSYYIYVYYIRAGPDDLNNLFLVDLWLIFMEYSHPRLGFGFGARIQQIVKFSFLD